MTRMPPEDSRKASGPPTLPNPWSTARAPTKLMSSSVKAALMQASTPEAVAPEWLRVPPIDRGLPVTAPGAAPPPHIMDKVSMSQAMTRPSVLTSGAGTSRSGPRMGEISVA